MFVDNVLFVCLVLAAVQVFVPSSVRSHNYWENVIGEKPSNVRKPEWRKHRQTDDGM